MVLRLVGADEPPPPETCPACGRGRGDYPAWMIRRFRLHRPAEANGEAEAPTVGLLSLPPPGELAPAGEGELPCGLKELPPAQPGGAGLSPEEEGEAGGEEGEPEGGDRGTVG
jgi:hypothetical protein